jgi:tRNA (guanine10-N2)-dimethyltransferase
MKTYAFELSGEHQTLPRSEALALLEICSEGYREIRWLDQCLLVEARGLDLGAMGSRLAMTHRLIEVLAICDATLEALTCTAESLPLPRKSYRIRARRIKQAHLTRHEVEREVGRSLFGRGYSADLKSPEMKLQAILTEDKVVLGLEVASPDRGAFEARRPHLKPFFHPGVLMPRAARALVNLSRVREGEQLLDPFAGTGGILVEACLMGIAGVGLDVQRRLVRGARANLEGLDCSLLCGDAQRLPFRDASMDGAVLDTPYGRSALIRAISREGLLARSLAELHRVIKPGRLMVVVADRSIEDHVRGAGFDVAERHTDRVHRSLTRYIFLCRR